MMDSTGPLWHYWIDQQTKYNHFEFLVGCVFHFFPCTWFKFFSKKISVTSLAMGGRPLPGVSLSSHNWEQCDCLLITLLQTEICCFLPQIWVTDLFWMKLSYSSPAVANDKIEQKYKGRRKWKQKCFLFLQVHEVELFFLPVYLSWQNIHTI